MKEPHLVIKDVSGTREVILTSGPLTIGRNFTNLVVLEEPMASRFHCVIEPVPDGYRIRDLGSKNGTRVNGDVIRAMPLKDGDVVAIGKTEMTMVYPAPATDELEGTSLDDLEVIDGDEDRPADDNDDLPPVESHPEEGDFNIVTDTGEWEKTLRDRAESLPDKAFLETDIALINARGKTAYPPQAGGKNVRQADAVVLLRLLFLICFRTRASDMHVEIKNDDVLVRSRVDGMMVDLVHIDKELATKLLSMVKVLSDIDISVRNAVQEGHFSARVPSGAKITGGGPRRVDYRVSFAPSMFGQKLVIRVLDTAVAPLHISELQLLPKINAHIRETTEHESGMILVCGPTGSGKTTTLYACLRDIDSSQRNIVTIEDPVEVQLDGVTQIPVNEAQGNTFAAMLRSVLRQDPDAILVGEIRDADTARVAMQAAMTGHLVFSTVHTRDAVGTVYRLLDLGVEPYMVASGLHTVLAQRLVRQLCPYCRTQVRPTQQQIDKLGKVGITQVKHFYGPTGCRRCLNLGYAGRRSIVELLMATPEIKDVILRAPTVQEINKHLTKDSFVSLAESGYQLVAEGVTSFEEVDRAIA